MESKLSLSKITLRSNESWGPDPSFVFEQYRNLPFAPFNKLEKISKFCDVSNTQSTRPPVTSSALTNVPLDEGEEFHVVEVKAAVQKTKTQQPIKKRVNVQPTQTRQPLTVAQNKLYKMPTGNRPHYGHRVQTTRTKFKDNISAQADWSYIFEANKTNFDKTPCYNFKVTDLATIGKISEYDKTWDSKQTAKKNAAFTLPNTLTLSTGPRSDRFLLEHIEKNRETDEPIIYTTDTILSSLLTVKNSVFPWDIVVVKEGNQIFLEPSEKNKLNYIDLLTVNENTAGNLPEDEKDLLKACVESTNANRKFIEIVTKGTETRDFTQGAEGVEVPDNKVYKYREWTLDNKVHVVVRSEIDAYVKEGENNNFVKVCALNEFQSQQEWKNNYELNRGAMISSEIRNNLSKVCRWLCQAFLVDCNQFKLGFVTKINPKENKHQILTVEDMSTTTLSNTINFRLKDTWSIVKTIADIIIKQEDGVYSFVKSPYKQSLRIYKVPEKEEREEN